MFLSLIHINFELQYIISEYDFISLVIT